MLTPHVVSNLPQVFTELSDFIHQHEIKTIIGDGSSCSIFSRALAKAYERRHGVKLTIMNLGTTGGRASFAFPTISLFEKIEQRIDKERLKKRLKKLDKSRNSLLLTEQTFTGARLMNLSQKLAELGIAHKTATLSLGFSRNRPVADYNGPGNLQLYFSRFNKLKEIRKSNNLETKREYLEKRKTLREQLRCTVAQVKKRVE